MARHRRHRAADDTDDLPKVRITGRSLREAARLGGYLLPYKKTLAVAFVALALSSLFGLALPKVAGVLINGALTPAGADAPWYRDVNATALVLAAALALQASFSFLQAVCFGRV